MQLKRKKEHYTYADYCTWDDDQKCELIDGEIHLMASPSKKHQDILLSLGWKFREYLQDKACEVIIDFDVQLNWDKADDTVLRPDLIVVCDPEKTADGKSCKGTPDMIIEILSPSTSKYDLTTKFIKYREAAVKEFWIVDPSRQTVMVYNWENGAYIANNYGLADKITVGILPELIIDMKDIFETEEEGNI